MSKNFSEFNLHPVLLESLNKMGYTEATKVQEKVLPYGFSKQDLMVSSQTGSGKTAAFLLPILNELLNEEPIREPRARDGKRNFKMVAKPVALILCPTRELAQQVGKEAVRLKGNARGIRISTVVGGMPYGQQIKELENATILVATPGRLIDLYKQKVVSLESVTYFVADEADRMLDLGFAEDLEILHDACKNCEQNLMFSATFPKKIMQLAEKMMEHPIKIELSAETMMNANISQQVQWTDNREHRNALLSHWLKDETIDQMIIFTSTQIESEDIAEMLEDQDYSVDFLHGGIPQKVRNRRLELLRKGKIKILVATDVAARGIDVSTITHVINIGLPLKPEDYVHRVGRTGRAGRSGVAVSLVDVRNFGLLKAIVDYTKFEIAETVIEGLEPTLNPRAFKGKKDGGRSSSRRGGGRSGGGSRNGASSSRDRNRSRDRRDDRPSEGGSRAPKPFKAREKTDSAAPKRSGESKPIKFRASESSEKRSERPRTERTEKPRSDRPRSERTERKDRPVKSFERSDRGERKVKAKSY